MIGVAGCIVGHIWWWTVWGDDSSGRGVLSARARAPEWLRGWMGEHWPRAVDGPRSVGGGVYVTPPRSAPAAQARPGGYQWGSGRRLGES
jgi:Derlin-2/3